MGERHKRTISDLIYLDEAEDSGAKAHERITRPWSREDYNRRVSTYTISSWYAKPAIIDPLECARFGWVNCLADMLECEVCKSRVLFQPPSFFTFSQVQSFAQSFKAQLIEGGHKPNCTWRGVQCHASFGRLPGKVMSTALKLNFQQRAGNGLALAPVYNLQLVEAYTARAQRIYANIHSLPSPASNFLVALDNARNDDFDVLGLLLTRANLSNVNNAKVACILALCGWDWRVHTPISGRHTHHDSTENKQLFCNYCQREIGLWNFAKLHDDEVIQSPKRARLSQHGVTIRWTPDSSWAAGAPGWSAPVTSRTPSSSSSVQTAAGRDMGWNFGSTITTIIPRPTAAPQFDPVQQHRWFCPWITNDDSVPVDPNNNTIPPEPGWLRLLGALCSPTDNHSQYTDAQTRYILETVHKLTTYVK